MGENKNENWVKKIWEYKNENWVKKMGEYKNENWVKKWWNIRTKIGLKFLMPEI